MQKLLNSPNRCSTKLRSSKEVRGLAATCLVLVLGSIQLGCTGRDIHSDLSDNPKILVRKWTLQTSLAPAVDDRASEFSNGVLVNNTLIFGSRNSGLISLYPKLMTARWNLPIKNGVVSELAVNKDSVYFGGGDGYLYSVNTETGKVNWRYDVRDSVISRPTIEGGRVFVTTSEDTVYAFDAGTGKWLWHYRRRSAPLSTIHGASAPLVDNGEVIAGLSDGFVVSLSLQDGQLKWEKKIHQGTKFTDVDAHPVLENGVIYVPSYDGGLYALRRQNAEVLWRFDSGGSKQVVIDGPRLFLPSSDGFIYALNKESSKILWKFELDEGTPTQLVLTDRFIIVGSSHQYLYVINKETGEGLYRFNSGFGSGFAGAPTYDADNQRIYILSGAGNYYTFMIRSRPRKAYPHGALEAYAIDEL